MVLGIIGILVSLALLITLAYRGMPVIVAAPIASLVALLFSWESVLPAYTEIFMPAMGGFVTSYLPVFLTGAIFGALMTATGYARIIATTVISLIGEKSAMLAAVLTTALMTYGGISLFVVVFVMYPLAKELFRAADIPRRLIPATIALGAFTFTMTALPGTPQVQNIIPGTFFGTGSFAGALMGIIGSVIIFGIGMVWLEYRKRKLWAKGEHFASIESAPAGSAASSGSSGSADEEDGVEGEDSEEKPGSFPAPANRLIPFLPLLTVFVVNFACTLFIFPAMDWDFLSEEKYGGISIDDRSALWAVIVGLVVAIVLILLINARHIGLLFQQVGDGAKNSMYPIFSTASEVGYGAVIASVAAFAVVRDSVIDLGANALTTSVVATSITAGLTGSSSGGMTIALNAFGEELRDMAVADGISMEAMHRVTAMAAGGLDTLPHSGAIITLLIVCGLTHRQSYKDIAVITIVGPVAAVAVLLAAVSVGIF